MSDKRTKPKLVPYKYIIIDTYDNEVIGEYKTMETAQRVAAEYVPMGSCTVRVATVWKKP